MISPNLIIQRTVLRTERKFYLLFQLMFGRKHTPYLPESNVLFQSQVLKIGSSNQMTSLFFMPPKSLFEDIFYELRD